MPQERGDFLSLELIQGIGRENMDRFDCIKMEIFCMSKLNHQIKRQKKKKYGLGNIFAANMTDKGLISLLDKELIKISAETWKCI